MSVPVITIYKNGDHHFLGKKVVVNRKHFRSFDNFLDQVTEDTRAGVAIRKIHTPHHGTKIASLENIQNGAIYVAAGAERFRQIQYDKIGENVISKPTSKPLFHSRIIVSSRYKKEAMANPLKNRIIFLYRNGEEKSLPMKLLLDKRTLKNMNTVLQYISNKINLTGGAVKSIYTLDTGVKVTDVNEINTNMLYVAVGSGKQFVKGKYLSYDTTISPKHRSGGYSNKFAKSREMKKVEENGLKPVVTSLSSEGGLNNLSEITDLNISDYVKSADDQLEIAQEGMSSSPIKEESDTNFIDQILDYTSDTIENRENEIDESISELVNEVSDTPRLTSPVNNASSIDELSRTPPRKSLIVNDEVITSEIVNNELSGTPPPLVTSGTTDQSNQPITEIIDEGLSGTPPAISPIIDESDEAVMGTPVVNSPINESYEAITESIDNELSGTPPAISPIIDESDEAVTGTPVVNSPINESNEAITESIDNELPGTPTEEQSLYKASGKQQATGNQVRDGKETVVEELIDKLPAMQVEEEIEIRD